MHLSDRSSMHLYGRDPTTVSYSITAGSSTSIRQWGRIQEQRIQMNWTVTIRTNTGTFHYGDLIIDLLECPYMPSSINSVESVRTTGDATNSSAIDRMR